MPLPVRALHKYTSPTKEAQQALKLFLKILPCIHKKWLAGNSLTLELVAPPRWGLCAYKQTLNGKGIAC